MLTLGIESTCDETACAIVRGNKEILSSVVASQVDLHSRYGGVVPELACRRHIDLILPIIDQALQEAGVSLQEIDRIAAATEPGLVGAVLIGVNTAKALALALGKPFIAVNHIHAHLYAAWMSQEVSFPSLGLVASGGHTSLFFVRSPQIYELIGETVDDAIGEAFDKVAKKLGLPYPGGPEIERLAKEGNPHRFPLKGGEVKGKPYHFSFSGLKTAVLYTLQEIGTLTEQDKADIAASFQRAACEDVVKKATAAAQHYGLSSLLLGGGVTNNHYLRETFARLSSLTTFWPSKGLSLDNAAMIAGLGSR